jgi:hypothetical protein
MRSVLTAGLLTALALALAGCASAGTGAGGAHEVVYSVTSDGTTSTSISYATVTGADVSLEQADDETLPWIRIVKVPAGAFSNSILMLESQLGETGTTITCDISVDGRSVASETSTGQFAAVSCRGTDRT